MKQKIIAILLTILPLIWAVPTQAGLKKLAQTGFTFLQVGQSARAEAMGGSYTMVGNDAYAMFYNPAGLSHMDSKINIVASRVQWIADISYNAFGAAYNTDKYGVFGINFAMTDYGELIGTQVAVNEKGYVETGVLDAGAYVAGIAYARQLTDKFYIGGQIKYASEHLGSNVISAADAPKQTVDNKVGGLAYDFGTIYYTGIKSLRMGMSIRNFSQDLKYEQENFQMPLTFRIGFAMDILDVLSPKHASHSLQVALDAVHPRDYTERINLGAEYWFMDMIALRGGYKFNHDTENLTAGLGFKKGIGEMTILIDYCYTNTEFFDAVNRLSLGISF